jgi:hypothetical protein
VIKTEEHKNNGKDILAGNNPLQNMQKKAQKNKK